MYSLSLTQLVGLPPFPLTVKKCVRVEHVICFDASFRPQVSVGCWWQKKIFHCHAMTWYREFCGFKAVLHVLVPHGYTNTGYRYVSKSETLLSEGLLYFGLHWKFLLLISILSCLGAYKTWIHRSKVRVHVTN